MTEVGWPKSWRHHHWPRGNAVITAENHVRWQVWPPVVTCESEIKEKGERYTLSHTLLKVSHFIRQGVVKVNCQLPFFKGSFNLHNRVCLTTGPEIILCNRFGDICYCCC